MTPERWQRIKAIFEKVIDLPESERAAVVIAESGEDEAVRAEVEAMLDAQVRDGGFSLATEHLPYHPSGDDLPTMQQVLHTEVSPEQLIDGNYRILRQIGRGGMGVVYLAEHVLLRDRVAIKILPGATGARADSVSRFLREGQMARAIRHPNVVSVLELRTAADGVIYMVMEYVEGETLRDVMKKRGPMPFDEAVRLLEPVASALDHAHGLGIVHRDLKPENVMVGGTAEAPVVKLLDLGLARLFESGDPSAEASNLTVAGQILGTPVYMPPEQWGHLPADGGADIDARADVYSLAVMLYEMVAGEPPFAAKTVNELRVAHTRHSPPTLGERVEGLPEAASRAITRALSKDRSARQASAGELLAELSNSIDVADSRQLTLLPQSRASRPLILVASAMAIVLLTFAGWTAFDRPSEPILRAAPAETAPTAAPAPVVERTMEIRLLSRKSRDGVTTVEPFVPSDELVFGGGDGIRFEISSPSGGYLYVLNEAPTLDPATALPRYLVIFPKPGVNDGSPALATSATLRIPETTWIEFGGAAGRETVWIVWSAKPVEAMAGVERIVTRELQGRITDAPVTEAIRDLLAGGQSGSSVLEWDPGAVRASIRGRDETTIFPIRFNHR